MKHDFDVKSKKSLKIILRDLNSVNYSCSALQIMQLNQTIDYTYKIAVLKKKRKKNFTVVGFIKDYLILVSL